MKYKLIVRPEAEAELEEAFAWYEQQVAGLGSQFLLAVDAAIHSVNKESPSVSDCIQGRSSRFNSSVSFPGLLRHQ